ncbi:MAG TPA: hypothetical protein PLK82_02365 [Bacteroidales bacterium]|nr:hypothetical protein [Bacteroidales bacterium]
MRRQDCPQELKILVADMITAYNDYVQSHELLFSSNIYDDIARNSETAVESFLENRRIWDELNHYKITGQILGKHPIFSWFRRVEEIRRLKVSALVTLKIRLENNLVRNRAAMRKQPAHPRTAERKDRIASMERELAEVNRLLNF